MLRVIVVDDEPLAANLIGRYLQKDGQVKVEKILCNPLEVIEEVNRIHPDVVFLDIEMPEITGLELAEQLTALPAPPEVVFITGYSDYAIEAFRVNALDYVMKPVDPRELERVIKKIVHRHPQAARKQRLRINALGGFSARIQEQKEPIKWMTSKCEELFAYMIFKKQGAIVSKWKLIDVLWPQKDEKKSEINLRSTVSRINKILKEYGVEGRLVSHNNGYRLDIDDLEVDAFLLEETAEKQRQEGYSERLTAQAFCKLYPGHLFENNDFLWAESLQTYYLRLFINLGKSMAAAGIAKNSDLNRSLQILEYIIDLEPCNEDLREMAMEVICKGQGKKALTAYYRDFEKLLNYQVGVEPRKSLQELYGRLMDKKEADKADSAATSL